MRAAAILGLGCSTKDLKPFQADQLSPKIEWRMGLPSSSDQTDAIPLFGGDGTVHRYLGQLVRLGLPVLVVPAGSGNDFARALGLRRLRNSLSAWHSFCSGAGNVREIDLGIITRFDSNKTSALPDQTRNPVLGSRYFCCVAGVGLDAEVTRRANRLPRWLRGHGGYALSFGPALFTFAPFPMKISVPSESSKNGAERYESWITRSDQPSILAAFANGPTYGGGMKIAPRAQMDDGLLDVCIIGGIDPFKLFCMFPTVYSGRHLKISEVSYFSAARVRVETEHPLDVYADGEYVCKTPAEIGVEYAALKVIVS
jgi:diacylglycerol kinase (ATP)